MKVKKAVIKIDREGMEILIHTEIKTGNIDDLFKRLSDVCGCFVTTGDTIDSIIFYEEEINEKPRS